MLKFGKKKLGAICCAVALVASFSVPAFATSVNVDGGTWDYGTSAVGWNEKEVYSNYLHPTKIHKSSCSIGTNFDDSDWTSPKATSFSSATGKWGDKTHAYHNVK